MTAWVAGVAVGREDAAGEGDGRGEDDGGVFASRRMSEAKTTAGIQAICTIRRTGP